MNRTQFAVAALCALVLLAMVIVPMSTQQSGGAYDPWLDYDENGIIDVNDLHPLGGAYGATGDSTKNVSVTNWPQPTTPLFTEYLYLRAQWYHTSFVLIDEDMQSVPYKGASFLSNSSFVEYMTQTLVYDRSFVYEKMPTRAYQILGKPTISLKANFRTVQYVEVTLEYHASLWKVFSDSSAVLLCNFEIPSRDLWGTLEDEIWLSSFSTEEPLDLTIGAHERLMVRVQIYAFFYNPLTGAMLYTDFMFDSNTDEFRLDIPIAEP